ncbi:MAG: MipA/OmpV family protein [Polaromonas sp.]|nr:MipA/OmpV family protein [Polaromonas sp.]
MKNTLLPTAPLTKAWVCAALLSAAWCLTLPARANGILEPYALLGEPHSAGLGAVVRFERSAYRGVSTRYDVLPMYLYEGQRFFLDAGRAGAKLLDSGDQRLDVFFVQRMEGFPSDLLPVSLTGMAVRGAGVDLGVSWRSHQPWGSLQAEVLHDVGSHSKGSEVRLGYSYDLRSGPWRVQPSLSVALRNAQLNNYYYGILPSEATAARPAYAPGAGINTTVGLNGSYELTQRWRLLAGVSATRLDSKIKDSPIVQKSWLPGVYLGATYDFGSQAREWDKEATPTWVKVLYGRATEDGCHLLKIATAQCLSTASTNATSIAGIQLGKTFIENVNGWPLDYVGYIGLTHHNDHGLQANGLQLDLFMKAFYSGFPWSSRVKTRLGMGAGVSVAQRAPYIEASTQAAIGKPTSRLLQYLDPTLDVSLGDLIGSRTMKNTYLGLGVSHRSGIFGASRLLGNVNGGSNYIYVYLESAL